jgi:hypothetical protein
VQILIDPQIKERFALQPYARIHGSVNPSVRIITHPGEPGVPQESSQYAGKMTGCVRRLRGGGNWREDARRILQFVHEL